MGASEQAAERAIVILKRAIDAAENSNQAGEDFVVAAAAGPELLEALSHLVHSVDDLIAHSGGVYGLHLNGDPAPWDSLTVGGRFEAWLMQLEEARAAIARAGGSR
jgi:hypothetical protein